LLEASRIITPQALLQAAAQLSPQLLLQLLLSQHALLPLPMLLLCLL
jgi:hypothetical protein